MRRRDRATARFCIALLAVVVAWAVLHFSGWGAIVRNVAVLAWRGNAMVSLAKRTPFTPPPAGVTEERLQAYVSVCIRIKPLGDKIDEFEATHAATGRRTSFKGRAAGLVEAYLHEFSLALQQQRMGPAEFAWINGRMREAGAAVTVSSNTDRVLYGRFRDRLAAATLGPRALKIVLGFAE